MSNNVPFTTGVGATVPAATIVETLDQGAGVQRQVVSAVQNGTFTTKELRSSTGAQTIVASSASDVTILASNANRLGATIFNDGTAVLYLLLANATSSATVYTAQIGGNGYYEVPFNYTGIIKGIWASATGNARVTELI